MLCTKFHIPVSNALLLTTLKLKLITDVCNAATLFSLQYKITSPQPNLHACPQSYHT
jgi:hypothetical protein